MINQPRVSLVLLVAFLAGCVGPGDTPEDSPTPDPKLADALEVRGKGTLFQVSWQHADNRSIEYDISVTWSWPELNRGQIRGAALYFEVPGDPTWHRVANKPFLVTTLDDVGGVGIAASMMGQGADYYLDEPTGTFSDTAPTNTVSTSGPLAFDEKRWQLQSMQASYPVTVHFVVFGSTSSELEATVTFDEPLESQARVTDEQAVVVVHPSDLRGQFSLQGGVFTAQDANWQGAPLAGSRAVWAARWPVMDAEGQDVRVQDPVNPEVDLDHYLGWVGYAPNVGDWRLSIVQGTSASQFDQPFLIIMPVSS